MPVLSRARNYGTAFPAGWFNLCDVEVPARRSYRVVSALGRDFAVLTFCDGNAFVLDAVCPRHGVALEILREFLRCPHDNAKLLIGKSLRWLSASPVLTPSDGTKPIPLNAYPFAVQHGMLFVWVNFEGRKSAPRYLIRDLVPTMSFVDKWEVPRLVYAHIGELVEGTAASPRLFGSSGQRDACFLPWTHVRLWFAKIRTVSEHVDTSEVSDSSPRLGFRGGFSSSDSNDSPLSSPHHRQSITVAKYEPLAISSSQVFSIGNHEIPLTAADVLIEVFSPGVTRYNIQLPGVGNISLVQTALPTNSHHGVALRVRFMWYAADPSVTDSMIWFVVGQLISQWWADIRFIEEHGTSSFDEYSLSRARLWFTTHIY